MRAIVDRGVRRAAWLLGASMLLPTMPTMAQDGVADASDDGTIIVTALRRSSSLMEVPLSIQASTGDQLMNAGIRDLTNLKFTVPGYMPMTNAGYTQIYIRGIGNSIYVGADPSVASFVDDVPRIYGSMADNLVDVERVEVLKGAQGGLYGRNATGGVVNVITRNPSLDGPEGNARVSYGEKNSFTASGYLNLPLGKHVAMNLTVQRETHDPYIKNIARENPYTAEMFPDGSFVGNPAETAAFFNAGITRPKLDDQDFWAVRGKILVQPVENFKIIFAGDYSNKNDNNGSANLSLTPDFNRERLVEYFDDLFINAVLPEGLVQTPGKFETAIGSPVRIHIREKGVSATVNWSLPGVDLVSITAHRAQTSDYKGGYGVELYDFPSHIVFDRNFTYQEFRALSTFDGPLSLLGGATYLENNVDGVTAGTFLSPMLLGSTTVVTNKIRNWSVYAQAGYEFTPALELTLSGRYMKETNKAEFTQPVVESNSLSQKKFIPAATLSYKVDGGNIYARWARGFKTGGVNIVAPPSVFPRPTDGSVFEPETVDTYEAGFKLAAADRALQFTGAVFYNDYRNIHADTRVLPEFAAFIPYAIINAKSARTWGVEGSVNYRVSPEFSFGLNGGYLNAKYREFSLEDSTVLAEFNNDGVRMPKSPEWQFTFNADMDKPLNDDLRLVGSLLVNYTASTPMQLSAQPERLPNVIQPAYWLTNARIGVKTTDDKYSLSLIADNLFNEEYFQYGGSGPLGNMLGYGRPRIVRGEFAIRF